MANPLPEEKQFYEQIEKEKIRVDVKIWDLVYNRIGDDITAINLLCQYYQSNKEEVPILEARKILTYTADIKNILKTITMREPANFPFPEFKDNIPLHPVLREMFTHHIGNDVYMINLMIEDTTDKLDPHPLSSEITDKVISRTRTLREFLEKLRTATSG